MNSGRVRALDSDQSRGPETMHSSSRALGATEQLPGLPCNFGTNGVTGQELTARDEKQPWS